jgi:nitrite reductase/ring-hydroxylating ferredoxin subunit
MMTMTPLSRRAVFSGAAAIGAAAALAACGDDSGSGSTAESGPDAQSGSDASAGAELNVADVPVGGGTIVASPGVVVTQPSQGSFKAFSAVCTHQGCLVSKVENGRIICACHNSMFSAADGSVVSGPATRALAARNVTVSADTLTVS